MSANCEYGLNMHIPGAVVREWCNVAVGREVVWTMGYVDTVGLDMLR